MAEPLKANPGGNLPPDQVFGRDRLIDDLWTFLESQSIVMTAERRQGKTQILKKMEQKPRANWLPVYQDLEHINSTDEFAFRLYEKIQIHLSFLKKTANGIMTFFSNHNIKIPSIVEIQSKQISWKDLITHAVADLVKEQGDNRLLFLWDEFPWMLDNIRRRQGEETAMEVLALLRSLRQGNPAFRMVLTGSVGLHHVLQRLKDVDQVNAPLNDTYAIKVPALDIEDAEKLANSLLEGEALTSSDRTAAAKAIAEVVDCRPFYIHHIVRRLKTNRCVAEPATVEATVSALLVEANDPWELGHFRDRIPKYYGADRDLVMCILDELAVTTEPLAVNPLLEKIKAKITFGDRTKLLEVLRLLERDHYVIRNHQGKFIFEFPLLGRWWKLDRGLDA